MWRVVEVWQALEQSTARAAAALGLPESDVQAAVAYWLERGAGSVRVPVGPSSRGASTDTLQKAGQLAALFGAAATVVYIAGGVVLALRLFFAHVNAEAVTGALPREFLLTVGVGQVLLPTLLILGLYVTYRLLRRDRAHTPGTLPWYAEGPQNKRRFLAAAFLASAVLVAPGAIAAAATNRGNDRDSLNDPELWWCFAVATAACLMLLVALSFSGRVARAGSDEPTGGLKLVAWTALVGALLALAAAGLIAATSVTKWGHTLRWLGAALVFGTAVGMVLVELRARLAQAPNRDWGSLSAIAASAALYSGGLVFAAVIFWPAFAGLEPAKVCTTAGFEEGGDLIGHTKDGVYLAEGVPTKRSVAAFPTSEVEEVFVGPNASGALCDPRGASGKHDIAHAISAWRQASIARDHARAARVAAGAATQATRMQPAIDALKATARATTAAAKATSDAADAARGSAAGRSAFATAYGDAAARAAHHASGVVRRVSGKNTPVELRNVHAAARRTASSASRAATAASDAARAALHAVALD